MIVFTRAVARALHNTAVMLQERDDPRICSTCIPDYMKTATEPRIADTAQRALLLWVNAGREEKFKNLRAWCLAETTTKSEVVHLIRQLAETMDANIAAATILERAALFHRTAGGGPEMLQSYLYTPHHMGDDPQRAARIFYTWLSIHGSDVPSRAWASQLDDIGVRHGLHIWACAPWRTAEEVIYALEACAYEITRI